MDVILIDDDIDTTEIFSEYLTIKGFNVVGVGHNGKEAAQLYQKLKPDVVVLDIMMPHFDGFFGIHEIRKLKKNAKIVIATADVSVETAKKLEDLSPYAILHKPYDLDSLEDLLREIKNIEETKHFEKDLIER
ncbi:response regulator [Nitrosopumilus sp. b1]|uniref:response regulator n=1 Tax=Nitrosopumilus sp. b1 TaxID=2109907 RepID=UPI0015F68C3A|nr:response regulator [Nitrosopumilus sp. b1]KAF6243375.1 response regulator [Nitrosopumilus sp. b1]